MDIQTKAQADKLDLQIAPLIDIVFLLLVFFIMTSALIQKEADISFILPTRYEGPIPEILPVEVLIEITAQGAVVVEGIRFSGDDANFKDLTTQLSGLRDMATAQGSPFYVNILPNKETEHQRVIDVMDACAAAGVKNLSFSKAM